MLQIYAEVQIYADVHIYADVANFRRNKSMRLELSGFEGLGIYLHRATPAITDRLETL